jgi:hypothetical protein
VNGIGASPPTIQQCLTIECFRKSGKLFGISGLVYQRLGGWEKAVSELVFLTRLSLAIGFQAETNRTGPQTILTFLVEASITGVAQIALWSFAHHTAAYK